MKKLTDMARVFQTRAYAPYSNFRVGAAVLADNGEIYGGCNVENASFGATICAERVAISQAISQGAKKIQEIAIVGDSDYTYPCGICRQFMVEFSDNLKVHIIGPNDVKSYDLAELIPFAFSSEELTENV